MSAVDDETIYDIMADDNQHQNAFLLVFFTIICLLTFIGLWSEQLNTGYDSFPVFLCSCV